MTSQQTLKIKRTSTTVADPTLTFGELAMSSIVQADSSVLTKVYIGDVNSKAYWLNQPASGTTSTGTYSGGSAISISNGLISVKQYGTNSDTPTFYPVSVDTNGLYIQIDNASIVQNSTGQLSVNGFDGGTY